MNGTEQVGTEQKYKHTKQTTIGVTRIGMQQEQQKM